MQIICDIEVCMYVCTGSSIKKVKKYWVIKPIKNLFLRLPKRSKNMGHFDKVSLNFHFNHLEFKFQNTEWSMILAENF